MDSDTPKCGASIVMGDDEGDNSCTFKCDLPPGHEGDHGETGNMYGKHPYKLVWQGDMREKCERCQALRYERQFGYCRFCGSRCCEDSCMGAEEAWSFCKECLKLGTPNDLWEKKFAKVKEEDAGK